MFNNDLQYELKFFGHYHDPAKNSDKIWGWILIEGKMYNFWGRRDLTGDGKSLKFKRHEGMTGRYDLTDLTNKKQRKGYRSISCERDGEDCYPAVEECYPNFVAHMKKQLMFARITGTVRNEAV